MDKIKNFLTRYKKIVIPVAILLALALVVGIYFALSHSSGPAGSVDSSSGRESGNIDGQEVSVADLQPLADHNILTVTERVPVTRGSKVDLTTTVTYNAAYVRSIVVDDSQVNYDTNGEYQATYTITLEGAKLRELLQDESLEVPFSTDGSTIVLNVPITVIVQESSSSSEEEPISEKESSDENSTGGNATGSGQSGGSSGGSSHTGDSTTSSGNSGSSATQPGHTHHWKTALETQEETREYWVTQEKQEYTLYRFYWYNTNTWEESRDANRFQEWSRSSNGQLYPLRHPFARPEDNPLFLEYDGNGNPVYTNDHTILSNLYEWVPCEPHMEYETVTVEVKVTRCTICGAIRE